jgi:hypothetical protein
VVDDIFLSGGLERRGEVGYPFFGCWFG